MVKRSIEEDLRNRNFGARIGNYDRNAVVKNPRMKQHQQRSLGQNDKSIGLAKQRGSWQRKS